MRLNVHWPQPSRKTAGAAFPSIRIFKVKSKGRFQGWKEQGVPTGKELGRGHCRVTENKRNGKGSMGPRVGINCESWCGREELFKMLI